MTAASAYAGLFMSALLAATILPASSEVVLATLLASGAYDPSLLLASAVAGKAARYAAIVATVRWAGADQIWVP